MKRIRFFMRSGVLIGLLFVSSAYAEAQEHSAHTGHTAGNGMNTMTVSPERLQSIGVKFEEAHRHEVTKTIRTVGRVETDERRLARVNIKLEGWIDQLYVNTTGQKVKKGQLLFTLYSPELVATQEEYLLAVRAAKTLGSSEFPEVAEGARSILEVSRRRLQLWDIADYHIRDLEHTGKVLKTLPFHAPLSGTVIEKTAVAGMRVMPGDVLYTIADLSKIWVIADIYEYELPLIETGQTAQVSLSYAPQTVFTGRIAFVYPTVDPETRTAKVRFELDNPKELLKPGMYANVELAVPLGKRLAVSKDAVLESGERQIIFIHHGGGQLEWRNVKIGLRGGDWVEIVEGLQEGEHIVTSANFLLDSESQLKSAVGGMAGMKH
jgi:Cu(I)/Ag(I) efflux system membrane fusion protein